MKRVPQAYLLALVALSFTAAAAQAAQDPGPTRAVRSEEGRQKGVTTLTSTTARELTGLIDEYQFNGMGDAAQLKSLDTLKGALARLEQFAVNARRVGGLTGAITLLVSHRFSTVRMADLILVVADGRVTESGSHDELVALGGLYAELFDLQAAAYR